MELADLHSAQPYLLARPQRTLHIKILISDNATLRMEKAGCHEAEVGEYKKLFSVSIGVLCRVITRSLGSIRGLVVH